ncbi:GGDEF domain-containing protein [Hyphomonas sp.]|uniref:GGDEF domain-containing protein n=1 Tax=Hyphomonas sp. TaxID=87 RepID=UPI003F73109E
MNEDISTRKFWRNQARLSAIVVFASVSLSLLLVWLSLGDLPPDGRVVALWLGFAIPAVVSPGAMVYVTFKNLLNHRLHQRVHRLANSDDLTGLANRRCFTRRGTLRLAEAAHTQPTDQQTALLLADIDWFKRVNDTYGHEAGDDVLSQVAQALIHAAPADALIARLGGEEFTVMCDVSGPDELNRLAERLRQAVEATHIVYRGDVIQVTISVGLAIARRCDTLSTFLSRADKALYDAKDRGRNRFALAA